MNGNKFVQRFQIYSKLDCVPAAAIRIPMQLRIVNVFRRSVSYGDGK